MSIHLDKKIVVRNPHVRYSEESIVSDYVYQTTEVIDDEVEIVDHHMTFKTERNVPRIGVMLVGWGGNNGSTLTAGIIANKHQTSWNTKDGEIHANYFGSLTQASTVRLGIHPNGESVYIPFKQMLPMVEPDSLIIGGK